MAAANVTESKLLLCDVKPATNRPPRMAGGYYSLYISLFLFICSASSFIFTFVLLAKSIEAS
jgi:hypothetical protein